LKRRSSKRSVGQSAQGGVALPRRVAEAFTATPAVGMARHPSRRKATTPAGRPGGRRRSAAPSAQRAVARTCSPGRFAHVAGVGGPGPAHAETRIRACSPPRPRSPASASLTLCRHGRTSSEPSRLDPVLRRPGARRAPNGGHSP
jgi:hypothetical protein